MANSGVLHRVNLQTYSAAEGRYGYLLHPSSIQEKAMKYQFALASVFAALVAISAPVSAKGALKGAAVGAAVGHVAGRHAVAGAAVGAAVGRQRANKASR